MNAKKKHWDIARMANTMAVTSTITVDPTRITVRIRNKIIKWLEQGTLMGGYTSQARKLGEVIAEKYKLPTSRSTWHGMQVCVRSMEMAREVIEVVEADWAAMLLEKPGYNQGYYAGSHKNSLAAIRECSGEPTYVRIWDAAFRQQVADVAAKYITEEEKEAIQLAIAAINGTDPIHCYSYTN